MTIHPQLVADLRAKFQEGCTPSRLIKHIAAFHRGDQNLFSLVQAYFREAFGINLVRISNEFEDLTSNSLQNAFLNSSLIHEMLRRFPEWGGISGATPPKGTPWFDSLVATDETELIHQAQPETLPEFSHCWQHLDSQAQKYIKRISGNANALYEKKQILAKFAERLQQRITELEKRLDEGKNV